MTWKPHATVAAIVERDNRFLMVEENVEGQVVYNQPAGHLEHGESLVEAVIRETYEETAWHFEPTALIGIYLWNQPNTERTFLRFAFKGNCDQFDKNHVLDEGIIRSLWMSREELLTSNQTRSPMVIKNIDDYLSGHHYPLSLLKSIDF